MKNNFVHIGLHKTSSTTLQHLIWPKVAKKINYQYLEYNDLNLLNISKSIIKNTLKVENLGPLNLSRSLVSWEGLSTWDMNPFFFETLFEVNKKLFGKDCEIILFLRNPKDLFTSIYIEKIMEFFLLPPEDFFINDDEFFKLERKNIKGNFTFTEKSKITLRNKFSPQIFSYNKIISIYQSYFSKVHLIKYEDCKNFNFCKNIFNLESDFNDELKKSFRDHIGNRSFSKQSVNFAIKFGKLLKFINLNHNKLKKFKYKSIFYNPKNSFQRFYNEKLLKYTDWAHLIRYYVDRKIKYKKFKINFDEYGINLDKLNKEYNNIKFDY